jgi:hypothetical protein
LPNAGFRHVQVKLCSQLGQESGLVVILPPLKSELTQNDISQLMILFPNGTQCRESVLIEDKYANFPNQLIHQKNSSVEFQ